MRFDVFDAPFDEALLLSRGVILRVLTQIAMAARFRDGLDNSRTIFALELSQFIAQTLCAFHRQWRSFHDAISLCRSCSRFTSTSFMCTIASHVASPAATVV